MYLFPFSHFTLYFLSHFKLILPSQHQSPSFSVRRQLSDPKTHTYFFRKSSRYREQKCMKFHKNRYQRRKGRTHYAFQGASLRKPGNKLNNASHQCVCGRADVVAVWRMQMAIPAVGCNNSRKHDVQENWTLNLVRSLVQTKQGVAWENAGIGESTA